MKIKKNLAILFLAVLLAGQMASPLSVCAGEMEQRELQEVVQEVNQRNRKLDAPKDSMNRFRYNFNNNKPKLTEEDNSIMWKTYKRENVKKRISAVSACKEVKWLFRLMRSQYGTYTYYGGDARFGKAERRILKEIGTKGTISTKRYQACLHRHLGFITDWHLAIGEELPKNSCSILS